MEYPLKKDLHKNSPCLIHTPSTWVGRGPKPIHRGHFLLGPNSSQHVAIFRMTQTLGVFRLRKDGCDSYISSLSMGLISTSQSLEGLALRSEVVLL
ncbi:hypothetical protein JTE90_023219 [Oedothorax gibbosus]|uniref:Uncharacterized protein n=1 Tax=Oedothorax gibbosus TaxID=931172 RepID=A0AAV6VIR8_9ARAC|nr:hypothetical protein JTE90_023219 [Oedothorax gibbosus]